MPGAGLGRAPAPRPFGPRQAGEVGVAAHGTDGDTEASGLAGAHLRRQLVHESGAELEATAGLGVGRGPGQWWASVEGHRIRAGAPARLASPGTGGQGLPLAHPT